MMEIVFVGLYCALSVDRQKMHNTLNAKFMDDAEGIVDDSINECVFFVLCFALCDACAPVTRPVALAI